MTMTNPKEPAAVQERDDLEEVYRLYAEGKRVTDPELIRNQFAEDGLEDGQRESGAGQAEGAAGEGAASQQGDMCQGGVAVEDLNEEPVDDGRRSQETAIAP